MSRYLPMAVILLLLIAFRWLGSAFPETLPNFLPLAALFFCGACMIKGWRGWVIPLVAWLATYPIPLILEGKAEYLAPEVLLTTAVAFAATYFIGRALSEKGVGTLLLGSVAASLAFHLITNGAAWIGSPLYPKNLEGLWMSLWTGPPTSTLPTWVFLRNGMAANVIFSAVFLSARFVLPKLSPAASPAPAR